MMRNQFISVLTLLSLIIAGCSRHTAPASTVVFYPAPPDTPRLQYLTSFSTSVDVTGKRTALQKAVLGEDQPIPIGKPYGIATSKGKVYICDATIRGLEIIDLNAKTFNTFIPDGAGQLKLPINCFVDVDGDLYVTDVERKEVLVFNSNLNLIDILKNPDTSGSFKPMDVCSDGHKVWVTNPLQHKVVVYEKVVLETGKYVSSDKVFVSERKSFKYHSQFPAAGVNDDSNLFNPINITFGNKQVYITDFGDFKIKIFTMDGKYQRSVGGYGKSIGQFVRPKGISVDNEGNLFVVDAGFENVQVFDQQNRLLMFFGGPYKGRGDMWLPAKVHVDYNNIEYYRKWVTQGYDLKYVVFVTNQYGPDKINVYGAIVPRKTQ